jgi:hypothetical protein
MDKSEKPIKKNFFTTLSNEDIFYALVSISFIYSYLYLSSYVGDGNFTAPKGKTFLWALVCYSILWTTNWLYWRIVRKNPSRNKNAYVWYLSVTGVILSSIITAA